MFCSSIAKSITVIETTLRSIGFNSGPICILTKLFPITMCILLSVISMFLHSMHYTISLIMIHFLLISHKLIDEFLSSCLIKVA